MEKKGLLTISEFAKLSGTKRKNLIYYDTIDLFSPDTIGENGYRYYSYQQLETINVIYSMKEIGTPLKEIKVYLDERSPERLIKVFNEKKEKIDSEIKKLQKISKMMQERMMITEKSQKIDIGRISVDYCDSEIIFVSPEIEADDDGVFETLQDFYELYAVYELSWGGAIGDIVARENLLMKKWHYPNRYFTKVNEPLELPNIMVKPAGQYAIGYIRGDYDAIDTLYERLYAYIEAHHLF
ncbi:MAG: MerR family transcriptional regulator, partial [Eubacterium sp.]